MSNLPKRDITFDLLRTLVIINAFILHFDARFSLSKISIPSVYFQSFFFTVGGFFFFTAGYMARKIYLPKFTVDAPRTTYHIMKKGISVIILYLFYLIFINLATDTKFPKTIISFLFQHRFFNKILFTFGVLYLISPIILFLKKYTGNFLLINICAISFLFANYLNIFSVHIPENIDLLFISRDLFLYCIIPSVIIFISGFYLSELDLLFNKKKSNNIFAIAISALFIHIILLIFLHSYRNAVRNRDFFTLIECFIPYIFILATRRLLLSQKSIKKIMHSNRILCIGANSLTFYVTSNIMISLMHKSKPVLFHESVLLFFFVGIISYFITYWHYLYLCRKISPSSQTT